jgi:Protein of unknown function (DUF2510)
MSTAQPSGGPPPPNWYVDPGDSASQRWWTGVSWSEHTRSNLPTPFATLDPYSTQPAQQQVAPTTMRQRDLEMRRRNRWGWAGGALAIVSFLVDPYCTLSVLAIVFSSIGIYRATKLREQGSTVTGMGWSTAGLVIGIVGAVFYLSEQLLRMAAYSR